MIVADIQRLQILEHWYSIIRKEAAAELVITQVQVLDRIPQAREVLRINKEVPGEVITTQIDIVYVPELRKQRPDVSPQAVGSQIQHPELLKIPDPGGKPLRQVIPRKIEVSQPPKLSDPAGNGPVELVSREIQAPQRGHAAEAGHEAAGQGIAGEAEVLEASKRGESRELEVTDEAEAGEVDGHDAAGGVTGDAVPRSADGGSRPGLVPGPEHAAGGVG